MPYITVFIVQHSILTCNVLLLHLLSECTVSASRKLERQAANRQGGQGSHDTAGWIQRALGARNLKCLQTR